VVGVIALMGLPRQFKPDEDTGKIYISGQATPSSTIEFTDRYVKQIDDILATYPEIKRRVTSIKNPSYDITVELYADRKRSTDEVTEDLKKKLAFIPGVSVKFEDNERSSDIVSFVVGANKSLKEVREASNVMVNTLYGLPDVVEGVLSNKQMETEEYILSIRRNKASSLHVEPKDIANVIEALVKGRKAGSFKRENRLYDVMVEIMEEARRTPRDITNLFVRSGDKEHTLVPVSELVEIHSKAGAAEIYRFNKLRAVSMSLKMKPGVGMNEGINAVLKAKEQLPKDVRVEFRGETKQYIEESYNMILIFVLAIAFIYFVLAAQFESWLDPFIIMLSVPLSLAGAAITLILIKGGTLNIYSEIGLVTLIGLITKHGILIVEFSNQLRDQNNLTKFQAVIEASCLRLRPILMTTFAMVLGAVPLALATGAGSESRRQIGWVVVGGMSIGTVFTLIVLPAIYLVMSRTVRKNLETVVE
jgi:multidrug efflux pump